MIKVLTVIGARPQFIKAAAVSRAIREEFSGQIVELLVHTGQHYDGNMSKIFFDELDIPQPKHNLEVFGGSHGEMTGRMLEAVEGVLISEQPDLVMIYGDTNSTLAGALAAAKLHVPVAHVEAGLRSFNNRMPEEINRIVADRLSQLLFCPTETAVNNLSREGVLNGVENVGDVMLDASLFYRERAKSRSTILQRLGVTHGGFVLATCHRAENTDDTTRLHQIIEALAEVSDVLPVVLPLHPRTRKLMLESQLDKKLKSVKVVEPLPFFDMIALEQSAKVIMTDSGGVQKEAFFFGVPCITMRDETEWVETVASGLNHLVGASKAKILEAFDLCINHVMTEQRPLPYGDGRASQRIVQGILRTLK